MAKSTTSKNAGVHGSTGIEFQKHCALFILFERYAELKDKKYFICLEHHDDFLYAFQSGADLITSIEAYQAKKSSTQWGMTDDFFEVFAKIIAVGLELIADTIPKDPGYTHILSFVTNNSIKLNCGNKKGKIYLTINESNYQVKYSDIDTAIQAKIIDELKKQSIATPAQLNELKNLSLVYIDLPKAFKHQRDTLIGQFHRIFGTTVKDPEAAVDTLLKLFRNVETVINQGNVVKLMDESKRVNSTLINQAINVIETNQKAYELWRTKGDALANLIGISVFEQKNFALQFQNSLDLFKDLSQSEHQKILKYVKTNATKWQHHVDDVACINDIYETFKAANATNLNTLDLKAAIFAAYIELKG